MLNFGRGQRTKASATFAIEGFLDGLEIAAFACNKRGIVLYANSAARRMFEFTSPIDKSVIAVTLSHSLEAMVSRAVKSGERQSGEQTFRSGLIQAEVAVWRDEKASNLVYVTLNDITQLRKLERVRQDFVANVSHELRTPLANIRSMSEVLLDIEPEEPELREKYLKRITNEVDRLALIVSDLLVLSAAESTTVLREPCDLAELLTEVGDKLRSKSDQKGIQLLIEAGPSLQIEANSTQLTQVLLNLIDNAINYTSEGQVTARLERIEGTAVISVEDTGIGIASEHQPRIFERFYRVDKGRSRASGGTGLGLSIVKHLVEAHGGTVTVESELNRGTTFTVRLPIQEPA